MAFVKQTFGKIGPIRHVLHSQGTTYHHLIRMKDGPFPRKLVVEALIAQSSPGFFDRDILHPIQNRIRNLWPTILKPLSLPLLSKESHVLSRGSLANEKNGNKNQQCQYELSQHNDQCLWYKIEIEKLVNSFHSQNIKENVE